MEFREIDHGSAEYEAALRLRDEILRRPLGMSLFDEDLSAEVDFLHIAGFDDQGNPVAYLHLKPHGDAVLKMQQVAVAEDLQGRGIGRGLVAAAEGLAGRQGAKLLVLHARELVIGFYEALGYHRVGDRFTEIGIPHFKAEKELG